MKFFFFVENSYKAYQIAKKKFRAYFLNENIKLSDEKKIIDKFKFDIFIYEGERLPLIKQKFYKSVSKEFFVFDDNLNKLNYFCDKIFCCQLNSNYKKKKKLLKNKIFYGYNYFPIFAKKKSFIIGNSKNIIVILGGGEYFSSYELILDYYYKKEDKIYIFCNNEQTIIKLKKKYKNIKKFKFIFNCKNISLKIPKRINYAIVNGGYNKLLFNFLKIPSVVLCTRYHQLDLSRKFCKITNNYHLGYYKKVNLSKIDRMYKYFQNNTNLNQKYIFKSNNLKNIFQNILN